MRSLRSADPGLPGRARRGRRRARDRQPASRGCDADDLRRARHHRRPPGDDADPTARRARATASSVGEPAPAPDRDRCARRRRARLGGFTLGRASGRAASDDYYPFVRVGRTAIDSSTALSGLLPQLRVRRRRAAAGQHVHAGRGRACSRYEDFVSVAAPALTGPGDRRRPGRPLSVQGGRRPDRHAPGGRDRRRRRPPARTGPADAQLRPARHLPAQGRRSRSDQVEHDRAVRRPARRARSAAPADTSGPAVTFGATPAASAAGLPAPAAARARC